MSLARTILSQRPTGSGPEWLEAARARHAERVLERGLPGPGLEEWKYTSLAALDNKALRLAPSAPVEPSLEELGALAVPGFASHRLVFVNGRFAAALSLLEPLPPGASATPLAQAGAAELEGVRARLAQDFAAPETAFAALNTAAAGDGLIVRLEAGCALDRPLECLYLSVAGAEELAVNLRNVFVLGEGARAVLIERHAALGEAGHFTNLVDQFELGPGANLEHVRIQTEADSGYLVTRADASLAQDAEYRYHGFDLGGRTVRHDVNASLDGPGARCALAGVYALDGRRHVDNHTRIDHRAPRTVSTELFKGVVDGRARAVFNGKVVVHPGADGTDATQSNRNLVLSPHAEVDTKPELEIYADDVKCAHGATVGQLDEAQLFYLRSRGLAEREARALLTYAFCREVVDRLEAAPLRDHIAARIVEHLPRPEALEEIG